MRFLLLLLLLASCGYSVDEGRECAQWKLVYKCSHNLNGNTIDICDVQDKMRCVNVCKELNK